jgi:hypothetical protein
VQSLFFCVVFLSTIVCPSGLFSFGYCNGNIIKTEDEVKLLGVTIDYELKFNSHITNICRKASRQLNVLKRMGKYLNRLQDSLSFDLR